MRALKLVGGQFTANGAAPRVWTEFLSDSLDTPAQCAARTGMLPNDGTTEGPVTDFPECDNYAQGSARVTFSGTGPNGVLVFDDYAESTAIAEDPAAFGYANVTTPCCGNNAFSNPSEAPVGPSIVCNATNLIDEATSQFALADDVRPTPYAHQKTAEAVLELMASVGWQ